MECLFSANRALCLSAESWDDLSGDILCGWLPEMNRLLLGVADHIQLLFMDGPYGMTLTAQTPHLATARFCKTGEGIREDVELLRADVDVCYFARQMLSASEKLLCHWPQEEQLRRLRALADKAAALRRTLQGLKERGM